jgi:hypothetical protein
MITRRSLRLVAFACAAGLAGAACGGTGGGDDSSAPAPAADTATADTDPTPADAGSQSAAAVPALLQFTAPLIGGGEIAADELAGKPTAFWFWSPT